MDIRSIRYFLAVADAGSITQAARALHLSQPPLSAAMARLEAELGVVLLDRQPRGVGLTEAGKYLQAAGRRLVAEEQRLSSTLKSIGRGLEGELRVGAEPMGLWRVVSACIASFLAEHPKVALDLMDAPPQVQLESLASGHLELAVIPVLAEEPLQPVSDVEFFVEIIAELPLTVIAPSDWDLGGGGDLELSDLRDVRWVQPARMPGARSLSRVLDDRFASAGGSPADILTVPTVQTAANLVAAGVGVSLTSLEMVEQYPGVSRVPVAGGWPPLPIGLVRRRNGIVTPIAERFAGLLRTGGS